MTNASDKFIDALDTQHYASIPFPATRSELLATATTFLEFLALPDLVKRQLHFPARSYRASADGYTDKVKIDHKDPKQFFHWSPILVKKQVCTELRDVYPEVDAFFNASENLYRDVESVLWNIYDQHLPSYRDRIFKGDHLVDGILRFLCYAPRKEHSFCAQAHFDKGFSTLAVADSAPGLRIGCCNQHPLAPVTYREGTAIFMPAWMLFQASEGKIKPAWHDVIHSPEEQDINSLCARWSIVFFVNSPGADFSSWEKLHTPLH